MKRFYIGLVARLVLIFAAAASCLIAAYAGSQ